MKFCNAIENLRAGEMVQREGWNGKDMFLFQIDGNQWDFTADSCGEAANDLDTMPFICMKTADNKLVPWLASQSDVLADDWQIYEE